MNWKMLMLTFGGKPVCLAPAGDEGGGDAPDEPERADDEAEADDEESDEDEEADDEDGEAEADDEESDEDETDEGKDYGKGAQKRIRQLNDKAKAAEKRAKDLERELADAKKLSGDDGRALLAAAEASGILPGLMTKGEAEAFQQLADLPTIIDKYRDWLDEHGSEDELEIGADRTMAYGAVRKRVRKLEAQLDDLKDRYGERRRELQKKVRGIFELGLKAQEAGWTGEKKKPAKERKKLHDKPVGKRRPKATPGRKENWGDVSDEKDFVRMIAASNKEE
ncbi:MAG: hypothetical protein IJ829_08485 [Kiritimatiellae bacterium]|nr:hypothetical protein [Kiritimatiellia bacterium]